ncbi:MAG TPA: AraC family transcriptional regulator, partial [Gammaproteobacteria bacterium]|nr:AraC family transcriptional regulator [Gammaproteobacteria bacterium]
MRSPITALLVCLAMAAAPVAAEDAAPDEELRALKQELVALNRDLFLLEEELLFPASTQVAVYLSLDVGKYFALDAVELSIDDQRVAKYLYTEREIDALHRGGVHRLYVGNLKSGRHELVAVLTGRGPQGREYRRATSLEFDKGLGPQQLELVLR